MTRNEKINFILNSYDSDSQIEMAIEECSELILALQKYKRNCKLVLVHRLQVNEEIADVAIMIEQLRLIFDNDLIEQIETEKLDRELNRINCKK